jgi:hypothetical protein
MIKHIVCFKLKEGESAEKAKEVLLSMTGKVPTAKAITVGIDELHSQRSFDIILEVLLEDFKALEDYQVDPYHCDVVKKHMHAVAEKSIALDFTL